MWIILALGSALALSLSDVAAKRAMRTVHPWSIGWLKFGGAAVCMAPFALAAEMPEPWPFMGYLLLAVPIEAAAIYLYNSAISRSPLSLTVPMLAFTPVFLLVVAWALLGEKPEPLGLLGVALVTAGAYLLHLAPGERGLAPFRAMWREPGPRMMLAVAFLYSFTASLGKKLVLLYSPTFFAAVYPLVLALVISPLAFRAERKARFSWPLWPVAGVAVTYAAMVWFHFQAIALAPAAYMIAVKRMSLLFAVVWGRLFFAEFDTRRKTLAAGVMVLGVGVLAFA